MEAVIDRMPEQNQKSDKPKHLFKISKRPLDPMDRVSEIWFELAKVLTFTCLLSASTA